jgi:beta-hydroxylase
MTAGGSNLWARLLVAFRSADPAVRGEPTAAPDAAMRRAVVALAGVYARIMRRWSSAAVFLPTERLEWVGRLEASWRDIRDEVDRLRGEFDLPALIDMIPGERAVTDGRWKMLMLHHAGRPVAANRSLCPRTAALLDQVPGLVTANLSVLEPGARIAAHHGIFAGVLRYHLGLAVPARDDRCAIRVGGETRHWREGGSLLFDDTRRHEAWNLTAEDRIVLLLDVRRPLPPPLRWINAGVLWALSRFAMAPLARTDQMLATPAAASANTRARIAEQRAPAA